jgi:lysophospholipid acyltransferase (LPLAT)-like uncharacterized protein
VLWAVLRLLFASCRVVTFGADVLDNALRTHQNRVLGAIWHRNMHVFSLYRAITMASRSRDKEYVAQTLQRFCHITR